MGLLTKNELLIKKLSKKLSDFYGNSFISKINRRGNNFRSFYDAAKKLEKWNGWDGEWSTGETIAVTLEALKFKFPLCNYNERIDYLLKNNEVDFPFPNIPLNLEDARILANRLTSYFDWIVPTRINFIKPEEHDSFNKYFNEQDPIPLAVIYNEYISYNKKCCGTSDIYICRKEFITVGILLHELAHMYHPIDDHGEDFYFALNEITKKYWPMRQFN